MKKIIAFLVSAAIITIGAGVSAENVTDNGNGDNTVYESVNAESTAAPEATEIPESTAMPEATETPESTAMPEATETPESTVVPQEELSNSFKLNINITQRKYIIPSQMQMELYNADGEILGKTSRDISQDTDTLEIIFDVPQYRMGEVFKVKLISGLRTLRYYDSFIEPGGSVDVQTYGFINDNGEYVQNNGGSMTGEPDYEKELCMYVNGSFLQNVSPRARIVDGVSMMPVRAIGEAMGLKVKYDPNYDSVVCSVGSNQVIFNAGSAYTTIFGSDTYAPHETIYIEGSLFVPVRTLAEAFGSSLDVLDYGDHLDVVIGEASMVRDYRNSTPVNRDGIGSRTNYLIWVSKSEYTVRVYEGQQYNWELLKEFPCALGAWNTPTITGQFEIIERTEWDYANYYVGPVLRFYNGYALHSTLLYYGGGEYDGRVGVNISHGCVRLHPQDINWIADTVPFYTRVYITE